MPMQRRPQLPNGLLSVSRRYNSLPENEYITGVKGSESDFWEFNYNKRITLVFNTLDGWSLTEDHNGSAQPLFQNSSEAYNWRNRPAAFYPTLRIKRAGGNTQNAYFDHVTTDVGGVTVTKVIFKTDKNNNGITIEAFPDGSWLYRDKLSGVLEVYNQRGQLVRINSLNGQYAVLSYTEITLNGGTSTTSLLNTVTDNYGRSLRFQYNPQGLVSAVTLPNNQQITYQYDGQKRLTQVTRPGYGTKTYHYSENNTVAPSGNPSLLTGITDETGHRFATYTYDNQDRAISTEHSQGVDRYVVDYSRSDQAKVTDARDKITTYNLKNVQGYNTATTLSENGLTKVNVGFDSLGNVISTVKDGMTTQLSYDPQLNLETSSTEAVGTAQERVINTTWHADFPKPTQIQEVAQGQVLRTTTYTYDNNANTLTKTITDPNTQESRTWSYEYNNFGQMTKQLTPNGEQTTYQYDENNGNLLSSTDVNAITTSYSLHNADGQPTRITTSTGLMTELVYDDAGRVTQQKQSIAPDQLQQQQAQTQQLNVLQKLLNALAKLFGLKEPFPATANSTGSPILVNIVQSVQQALTAYQYDPRGLLITSTLADGERIEYSYDDAHRLTEIKDQSGNRTVYTLSPNGDITQTEVYGTTGQLEAKNQQVYDNLGRLQQTLGNNQQVQTLSYNNYDQKTSDKNALNQNYGYSYDVLGRQIKETDPLNQSSQYEYDALDQLKKSLMSSEEQRLINPMPLAKSSSKTAQTQV